jgi:hypothetical protein
MKWKKSGRRLRASRLNHKELDGLEGREILPDRGARTAPEYTIVIFESFVTVVVSFIHD